MLEDNTVFENEGSGKHGLSPDSSKTGTPKGKMIAISSKTPTSPASLPPPIHSPPPPPLPPNHSPPPLKPKPKLPPIPPYKSFKAGNLVEVFTSGGADSSVTVKLISRQVKSSSQDYEKYKHLWNVEVLKGNSTIKKGERMGFDFLNPHHYRFIPSPTSVSGAAVGDKSS